MACAPSVALSARLDELEIAQTELNRVIATLPRLDNRQLFRMRSGRVPNPEGVAQQIEKARDRGHAIWQDLDAMLTEHFLGGNIARDR